MTLSDHDPDDAVTVVVPTCNRGDIVGQTIDSILAQEGVSVTLVVVDDASTDNTQAVLARFPSVEVLRHAESTEQRKARNHGARLARTNWIAFCDDDDLWAPQKLRRQLDVAKQNDADWCTCSALFVDESLRPIGAQRLCSVANLNRLIVGQNVVPGGGSGVLMRTALFEAIGGFREDARYVEDWDLWIRLAQNGSPACVDELLVAQRQWSRSFSHMDMEGQYLAFSEVTQRYGGESKKPRNAGYFEVRQRLRSESRWPIWKDLPRIIRKSPEDWRWALMMLMLPRPALRSLDIRLAGADDVDRAMKWLDHYRLAQVGDLK